MTVFDGQEDEETEDEETADEETDDEGTADEETAPDPEEGTEGADAPTPADTQGTPLARGKRKRKLGDVAEEALAGQGYMITADPDRNRVKATLSGEGIEAERADIEATGETMKRFGHLLSVFTGSRPQLYSFSFASSVVLEIGAPEEEISRANATRKEVEAEKDDKRRKRLMYAAVPETTLAAYATRDLLEASQDDVVSAALSYGTAVAEAYKSFVRVLADEDISLSLELPTDPAQPVVLTSETASQHKEAMRAVGSEETLRVKAVGILSMADAGSKQIRLQLDREAQKEPALRGRRAILARYTSAAGNKIQENGLWNTAVIATFEMTRDRRGTSASVRRPTFLLVDVEPRYK
jgi:hypothetical protein